MKEERREGTRKNEKNGGVGQKRRNTKFNKGNQSIPCPFDSL
jgi:hypothetical protein